jgi:hypothetical protein
MRGSKLKPTKHTVIVYSDDEKSVLIQPVLDHNAQVVETEGHIYHLQDAQTFVNQLNGGLVYTFKASIPSAVEAANLKSLRRSISLKRVFEYDRDTGKLDIMKLMPWLVIVILAVFK